MSFARTTSPLDVLQAAEKGASPSTASFEETYKTAYSHGLEEIYALETVDLSSVKPMRRESGTAKEKKWQSTSLFSKKSSYQLSLPFADPHLQYIDHFLLREPIEVLLLTERIEESLKEAGCYYLYELLSQDLHQLAFDRKLGSGHIQEIQNSLHAHIQSDRLYQVETVDFASLCRAFIPPALFVQAAALAKEFGVQEVFPLRPQQKMEVKSAGQQKLLLWKKQLSEEMLAYDRKRLFSTLFSNIVQVFLLPWMRERKGVARNFEILERLQNIAIDETLTIPVLTFLSSFYFSSLDELWSAFLSPCEDGVYASSPYEAHLYSIAVKQTKTYFSGTKKIAFMQLLSLMEREAACFWFSFPEGFLERFFKVTSYVTFVRSESNQVFIRSC